MAPIDLAAPAAAKPATPPPITRTCEEQKCSHTNVQLWQHTVAHFILNTLQGNKTVYEARIPHADLNVNSYLSRWYFSRSRYLTSEKPSKVVGSKNHGLVPTKPESLYKSLYKRWTTILFCRLFCCCLVGFYIGYYKMKWNIMIDSKNMLWLGRCDPAARCF